MIFESEHRFLSLACLSRMMETQGPRKVVASQGRLSLETARYSIPSLAGYGDTSGGALELDLSNALTVLDGVGHVDINRESHIVTVDFDPDYMDLDTLAYVITGTGYPVEGAENVT